MTKTPIVLVDAETVKGILINTLKHWGEIHYNPLGCNLGKGGSGSSGKPGSRAPLTSRDEDMLVWENRWNAFAAQIPNKKRWAAEMYWRKPKGGIVHDYASIGEFLDISAKTAKEYVSAGLSEVADLIFHQLCMHCPHCGGMTTLVQDESTDWQQEGQCLNCGRRRA